MACRLTGAKAIIWTNVGLLVIGPLGTNFSETLIEILTFPFKKMRLKVWSAKRRPFCLGLNVLNNNHKIFNTNTCINTLRPRQNGCHFPDNNQKHFLEWKSVKISLKFVPRGPINNIPALVQIMVWRRPGNKPSSEPVIVVYWRIYASLCLNEVRHWGWDKMAIILQTTFSHAFHSVNRFKFRFMFHWNRFPVVLLIITQHDAKRPQDIIWSNDSLVWWCISVSLSFNELKFQKLLDMERQDIY